MRGRLGIAIIVLVLISLLTFYAFFDEVKYSMTGKQIFLDDKFTQPVSSFKTGKSNTLLSPAESDCFINNVSWDINQQSARILVDGTNCNGQTIEVDVYERDLLVDDYAVSFEGEFVRGNVSIDWAIAQETLDSLKGPFEGKLLEIYFSVMAEEEINSPFLLVSTDDSVLLQPEEVEDVRINFMFWFFFVLLAAAIVAVILSIRNSLR